jgi:4-alpha-glucanotransferase
MPDHNRWGVAAGFWDVAGRWHDTPDPVVGAVLAAMGADDGEPPSGSMVTVRLDHPLPPVPAGRVVLEDGADVAVEGPLPADLPPGYHRLEPHHGPPVDLLVSPGRCPLPDGATWGFATQLYATRSRSSWGIGDLADLRHLGRWSGSLGAGVVMVSPLHATAPTLPQQPSPYYAGSRSFFNPLYLAVEEIPGADTLAEMPALAAAGRALNAERLIDRDQVWRLKAAALESLFDRSTDIDTNAFAAYRAERGATLDRFATYCALAEMHGPRWPDWPAEYRHPGGGAVTAFAADPAAARRIRYHAWLQWLLEVQMARLRTGDGPGAVLDLAVGVDPGGADTWMFQNVYAPGMSVGAPPDEFNTKGQGWGLAPYDPWRLRSAGYAPLIDALRSAMRHGRGVRIDHVMGLFRQYWIPDGSGPKDGAYVRYPHHDLLNILSLEAHRAAAFVVGEDLGTVEDEVRHDLAERNVLSYRVWWFEPRRPAEWPAHALGSVSTHDLPTLAGVLTGSDLEAQRAIGLQPNEESSAALRERLLDWTASDEATPVDDVIVRVHADLGTAPCVVLTASLDDAFAVEERPNMPGTVDEWPNWRLALPRPLEDLEELLLPRAIAARLTRPGAPEP